MTGGGFRYWRLRERYEDSSRTEITSVEDSEESSSSSSSTSSTYVSIRSSGRLGRFRTARPGRKKNSREWCRLAYWEERERVGKQIPIFPSSVDVFAAASGGGGNRLSQKQSNTSSKASSSSAAADGICNLESVFWENPCPTEKVISTRKKIGQGILLSKDDGQVWVYNRTKVPLFIHSPTLDEESCYSATFSVCKIPPGYSVQVFDYEKSRSLERRRSSVKEPLDLYSVRISFAKGWGKDYKRQDVTLCPCWLQVCLEPPQR